MIRRKMKSKESKLYPSDLTLTQWLFVLPLFPKPKTRPGSPGRPARDLRVIVNAIFYINKGGIQWRMLPKEYGPWSTAYGYFNRWSKSGLWKKVMDVLRKKERQRQARKANPSAGCVDSQSVKTATQGKDVGIDGGKLVKGRKRHILVDTLGILLVVVVTSANTSDKKGVKELLKHYFANGVNRLRKIWVDGGYSGAPLQEWASGLKKTFKLVLELVEKQGKGFNVVKRRWVVERTFAWLLNFRRNSKDYEILTSNSEAMLQISMIHILLRRLA
jgi:putative transposase